MSEAIYYHRYRLRAHRRLNAKSTKLAHEGVLIRIGDGFGCIHPWEVFGDGSVEEQLAQLAAGRRTRLISQALECVATDARARDEGKSVFLGLEVPESHATLVGGWEELECAVEAGFTYAKLKVGADVAKEIEMVNAITAKYPAMKLRLDFNCCLSGSQIESFIGGLSETSKDSIQFLEDPCDYNDGCWVESKKLGCVKLAMDMGVERSDGEYAFAIIKPAKNRVDEVMEKTRVHARKAVVTSYMDHPVGQAFAAYEAGRVSRDYTGLVDVCGLMTHELFEPNGFSEALGKATPKWSYAKGSGLGFDEQLERIEWTRLH